MSMRRGRTASDCGEAWKHLYQPTCMTGLRFCNHCEQDKPEGDFELTPKGHRRRTCSQCRYQAKQSGVCATLEWKSRRSSYAKRRRAENPALYIVWDSRSMDKKHGMQGNDLEHDFVEALIKNGCMYCGETQLRMTVDRIDNDRAHTQDNVNPCCVRCNYLRGSMPYGAWLHLTPAVREAVALGLFGDWRSTALGANKS